jgi:hypothetical protein
MRSITLNSAAEYQAFDAQVRGSGSQRSDALASLARLNPHVDFKEIGPGTIVSVPDVPAFREVAATSADSYTFEQQRDEILESLDGSVSRSTAAGELLLAEHMDLRAVLTEAGGRFAERDGRLKTAIEAATQTLVEEEKSLGESAFVLNRLRQDVDAELKSLQALLE